MQPVQWSNVRNYSRVDFAYPDKLDNSIVAALDRFTATTGFKAKILDDFRAYTAGNPNSRHAWGDAVDVYFPGADSLAVLAAAESSGLFDGLGIYLNERGAVSFHFDKRGSRARWGAFVGPAQSETGDRSNTYTTLQAVVDRVQRLTGQVVETVKKNPTIAALVVVLGLLWLAKR